MKRARHDLSNEELQEYIRNLSKCIQLQYSTYTKHKHKFDKTLDSLLPLLESRGYPPALIRYSNPFLIAPRIELSRMENNEFSVNSVVAEESVQLETILSNLRSKNPYGMRTRVPTHKELLEEVIGEKMSTDKLPIPWLLDETTPDQMQNRSNSFKEALKKFTDSDDEQIQAVAKEIAQPAKAKVGRPKGSMNKDKGKMIPQQSEHLNEEEAMLIERFNCCKNLIRNQSWSGMAPKQKIPRSVNVFGANSAGERPTLLITELEEALGKVAAKLETNQFP